VREKILFTGGSGLLALNCALYLRNDFEVYLGLHNRVINLQDVYTCKLNLENEQELEKDLIRINPHILINAAGMTNVEECESKPYDADKINAIVPGILARLSKKLNIYFVHISTDHLFDGTRSFQTEEDIICPLNVYGKSKARGEQEVLKNNNKALIIRTNFFGWGTNYRQSFSDFIIYSLRQNKKIILFDDVYYTPILIETLAKTIMEFTKSKISGIINVVSNERIVKYEFGILLAKVFDLDSSYITRGSIINNKKLVNRPKDMSLLNQKSISLLKIPFPTLKEQMFLLKMQEKKGIAFDLSTL
jgi:dTDP-4-dehydrorhamnose reductase